MKTFKTGPFPFIPITQRPKLVWPGGARIALWVVPNVEVFALDRGVPGYFNERPAPNPKNPNIREWARRDYGNRVGVWRIFDVLVKYSIPATISLNSDVCDAYPQIVEEAVKLGYDFMGHCRTNSEQLVELPPETERQIINEVLSRIERATGKKPAGWLGAGLAETWNTLDYLIDEGCRYVADWVNDDQPYLMNVGGKQIVSLPYSCETNDSFTFINMKYTVDEFDRIVRRQFDTLYREGADNGRVMMIGLHPYIIGQPHCISALNSALKYVCQHDGVWKATAADIVNYYLQSCDKI
jgi:allantoinase